MTKVWFPATSLGGVESLVEHRKTVEGPSSETPDDLLRLSVGLEHADDLYRDLSEALWDARSDHVVGEVEEDAGCCEKSWRKTEGSVRREKRTHLFPARSSGAESGTQSALASHFQI